MDQSTTLIVDFPLLSPIESYSMFTLCHVCHLKPVVALCNRCKLVSYCGKDCQMADWSIHKLSCYSHISASFLKSWQIGPRHGEGEEEEDSSQSSSKSKSPSSSQSLEKEKESERKRSKEREPKKKRGRSHKVWEPADENPWLEKKSEPEKQKRKAIVLSDDEDEKQNRELPALQARETKRLRPLDEDDLLRASTPEVQENIAQKLHIYQLRQWAAKDPVKRFALLDKWRHSILLQSPFIHAVFRHFAEAMQAIMVQVRNKNPIARCLVERAALWYDLDPFENPAALLNVPLLPVFPLGRHYIEILHWMELETFGRSSGTHFVASLTPETLDAHQFYLMMNPHKITQLYHPEEPSPERDPMEVVMDEEPQQAQEIPDDSTWALNIGQEFHRLTFVPWFQEMQRLKELSPSIFTLADIQKIEHYSADVHLSNLTSPIAQWLLDSLLENNQTNFIANVLYYSTTEVRFWEFSNSMQNEKLIAEKRRQLSEQSTDSFVSDPHGESLRDYQQPSMTNLLHPSILLGGYHAWLNIHQDPLNVLTMRHDLQLRHFHEKHVLNTRPWLLLYVMQGDITTQRIFSNYSAPAETSIFDPTPFPQTMRLGGHHNGLLVAAVIAVLTSHSKLWKFVSRHSLHDVDGSLLVLAIARGSIGILNEWYRTDAEQFNRALRNLIHGITIWQKKLSPIPEQGCYGVSPYHFLYHFAIVFQQPSVIHWLLQRKLTITSWDLLLPTQMLITQATMLQYDVDISIKEELKKMDQKGFKIKDHQTALAVKRWQDRIQVNVAERMDVHYQQETESEMLEIILSHCSSPDAVYYQHLSFTYLLWLYYLDQYYDGEVDMTHIGPKGNMHWHTIVQYLMNHDTLKTDSRRVIRSSELAIPESSRPLLNGFVDYPYIFSRVDYPEHMDDNSMDDDELNPGDFSQDGSYKNPLAKGSSEQKQWSLPERMCIHPPDAESIRLLDFLSDHIPLHNFEFVLNRLANILDTYRIFLFEGKKLVFSDYFAYRHNRKPLIVENRQSIETLTPHIQQDLVEHMKVYAPPPYLFPQFQMKGTDIINTNNQANAFEAWVLKNIHIHTVPELLQLLVRLGCFLRIEETDMSINIQYRFAYFVTAENSKPMARSNIQWYIGSPLYTLLEALSKWSHSHLSTSTQMRKLMNVVEDTRYETFIKANPIKMSPLVLQLSDDEDEPDAGSHRAPSQSGSLKDEDDDIYGSASIGEPTLFSPMKPLLEKPKKTPLKKPKKQTPLFELAHPQTYQPMVGFFFGLDRPLLAYHIPMDVATHHDTNKTRVMKRYHQIIIGKNTQGYRNYRIQIPLEKRGDDLARYPPTPRANVLVSSQRVWKEILRRWRVRLHQWDPAPESASFENKSSSSSASSSQSSDSENHFEADIQKYEQLMYEIQKQELKDRKTSGTTDEAFQQALNHLNDSSWINNLEHQKELYKNMESMVESLVDSTC